MHRRRDAPNLDRATMRATDETGCQLAVEILARLEPALELVVVPACKVKDDHRDPEREARSKRRGRGTRSRGRTGKAARPRDFKSLVSTNSTIRAPQAIIPAGKWKKGKCRWHFPFVIWSGKRVSNSRPIPWQGIALPTELFPRTKPAWTRTRRLADYGAASAKQERHGLSAGRPALSSPRPPLQP